MDTEARSFEHQSRFESVWIKELAEAEIASPVDDGMSSGPDVREIESCMSTEATELPVATEGVNADQVVERDGGASRQLDESQLQPMDVSLDQNDMTVATKQRIRTPSILNNVEEDGMVGCRSFDGHQDDQAELRSSVEVMKRSLLRTQSGMILTRNSCKIETSALRSEREWKLLV